jgi:tripartite-type tricarboxylate transporter receptor subunit TctC
VAAQCIALLALLLAAACPVHGQRPPDAPAAAWPVRAVRIVVPQAPGGPPDLIARFIAEPLGRAIGATVVVDNRPGASGSIGLDHAARSAPDGHTLAIGTLSTQVLVPHVKGRRSHDAAQDLVPVANLFRSIKVVWVDPALPVTNLDEFVAYARARPGQLHYASGGVGSSNHVDAAMLAAATGIDLVHVPYNGPAAGIAAVAGGQVQLMVVSITTGLPLARERRVRPLAVLSDRRSALLPDVPTAAEQGLGAIDLSAWIGLMAPAGTPEPVIARLNAELARILRSPETARWAERQGLEIVAGTPADFAKTIAADDARWGEAIRRLKLEPQ